ncbi:MAG: hypothetical protein WDZ79_01425 [Candidatus Paceibacterota bacterium]
MTKIKQVGVLSVANTFAVVSAALGLVFGLIFTIIALIGSGMVAGMGEDASGALFGGALFSIGAVIIMPIFYGIGGFIGGLVVAFFYNLSTKFTGGISIQLENEQSGTMQ